MKSRRFWNRTAFGIVVLSTLTALFYAVENWRGARAWTSTLEELRASGQKIALADFEPPPVPDESNAAMHPALRCFTYTTPEGKRAMRGKDDPPDAEDAVMAARWKAFLDWQSTDGEPFTRLFDVLQEDNRDLSPAQEAASALAPALASHLEFMRSVDNALKRPYCQWPALAVADQKEASVRGEYAATIGTALMEASRYFYVRKICEAIPSGALTAWDEGVVLGRFARPAAAQKTIMNYLLSAAIRGQQNGLVINLLEFTRPGPERCLKAEGELASQSMMSEEYGEYMRGERAFIIAAISSVLEQEDPSDLSRIISGQAPGKGWARVKFKFREYAPVGWVKQNLANTLRSTGEIIEALEPVRTPDEQRRRLAHVTSAAQSKGRLLHWMERESIDIYGGLYENMIGMDAGRYLLRAALLIAAHRSGTGVTPMSLDELPVELRSRVPVSPWNHGLPRIKRDETGIWTMAYAKLEGDEKWEPEFKIQIRGW